MSEYEKFIVEKIVEKVKQKLHDVVLNRIEKSSSFLTFDISQSEVF